MGEFCWYACLRTNTAWLKRFQKLIDKQLQVTSAIECSVLEFCKIRNWDFSQWKRLFLLTFLFGIPSLSTLHWIEEINSSQFYNKYWPFVLVGHVSFDIYTRTILFNSEIFWIRSVIPLLNIIESSPRFDSSERDVEFLSSKTKKIKAVNSNVNWVIISTKFIQKVIDKTPKIFRNGFEKKEESYCTFAIWKVAE